MALGEKPARPDSRWTLRGRKLAFHPHLSAEDRHAALDALMVRPSGVALRRFAILLVLSVIVASVGLLQNSTAVIIGAMLIAPLMAPIMGIAASLVMGWGVRLATGLAVVTMSVAGAIAIAWTITRLIPSVGTTLPTEVLSRTSPDIRDLLVALAAGTAGAYATVRRDISGALPGVAVAVALVPPLASVGVLIGRDQTALARGAGLLFATNLFGIILAASLVFLLTGFVPASRFGLTRRRILIALSLAAIPTIVIGAELTTRFTKVADHARQLEAATQAIVAWLGPGDDLSQVTLTGSAVQVSVTGPVAPPSLQTLSDALDNALNQKTTVNLAWTPVQDGEPTPSPTTHATSLLALAQLRPVVEQWLSRQGSNLDGMSYDGNTLVVTASGQTRPDSGTVLSGVLMQQFGTTIPISLVWTKTPSPSPSSTPTSSTDPSVAIARTTADTWISTHPGIEILNVGQNSTGLTLTLIGDLEPPVNDLEAELRAALPQLAITIEWVNGTVLGHLTPTPTTSPEVASSARPSELTSAVPSLPPAEESSS
jgi:uncharacterized hydrophobic protein (TIGR00271 family)